MCGITYPSIDSWKIGLNDYRYSPREAVQLISQSVRVPKATSINGTNSPVTTHHVCLVVLFNTSRPLLAHSKLKKFQTGFDRSSSSSLTLIGHGITGFMAKKILLFVATL